VVFGEGVVGDVGELRSYLKQRLPEYMVPASFIVLETLPRTANGKIDRKALPVPETQRQAGFVPPRTPLEEALSGIWAEVLEVGAVGVNDNFFDLGGHSLTATLLISRVRARVEIDVPLQAVFEAPTIKEFAARLDAVRMALKQQNSDGDSNMGDQEYDEGAI
jgi:hypothetical protein